MSQLSLFSASNREPVLADLEGVLAGPGQVVRRGNAARISVIVDADWRVQGITDELRRLDITAEATVDGGRRVVGTPWLPQLRAVADAWTRGAVKLAPTGWTLDGPRLRWWCLAAGTATGATYSLALGANDEATWGAVGAALAGVGVPAMLVGPRADGPAYRIVGRRRLARLRELVGDPPGGVPTAQWPDDGYARGA
jgi:hypothetical protein